MITHSQQTSAILDSIAEDISNADRDYERSNEDESLGDWLLSNATWRLEIAYTKLLSLSELLQLMSLRADIAEDYAAAKKEGLSTVHHDPDGGAHLKWLFPLRRYHEALECTVGREQSMTVTKDLESIIRAATYFITDMNIFEKLPGEEKDVHLRLEAVLKCIFPDLKHKPTLTKPIKNFEPDTGIPTIQTLIEYKFVSNKAQISAIADQLLADTCGYTSPEWHSFVYVIYETSRFRPEHEWRQMLRECRVNDQSSVIVISGEPPNTGARRIQKDNPSAKASVSDSPNQNTEYVNPPSPR